jgi:hypothetical protein
MASVGSWLLLAILRVPCLAGSTNGGAAVGLGKEEGSVTREEALDFVRKHKLVPFTDVDGAAPSFVRAIVGGPVRGSWWGHPKGNEIYNLAGAVQAEVLTVKLLGGKETLVHQALWPAFLRVVTDRAWRRARIAGLSPEGKRLLDAVGKGKLRLDALAVQWGLATKEERRSLAKTRAELERTLLVRTHEVHTDTGSHATVLEPWSLWAKAEPRATASTLGFDEALDLLRAACGSAIPAFWAAPGR